MFAMPDVTYTNCNDVSPQMAMSMGVADFLGPWILMPLNDLEAVATANGTAPHPRPIHVGLLSDLVQIRRLFDGAAEKIRRLANHDFEPPLKYDPRDVPPAPNKNPSFGTYGLSKMNTSREEVALSNAVTNLSRAFLINEMMLHFRGDGFLEMACEVIPKSFKSTEYGQRWHGSMDDLLEPDEDMSEPTLAKNRKSVQEFAQLALDDFMDFLSYLDYTPNPLSQGLPTAMKEPLEGVDHAKARKTSAPKLKPKIYAMSDLLSESPPDIRDILPEGADSVKDKSARGAATYHPLLGETLYSILLCHAILQTPASRLVRLAHTVAYLHSLCKPFPFTKITRPNAMADWEIVLVGSGNWINMPNLCVEQNKPTPGATSATVDLKNVTGSSICSADATLTIPERRRQREIVAHAFYLYDGGVPWHIKGPTDLVSQSLRDKLPKRPRIIGFWVENTPQPGESKKRKKKKKKKGKQASTSSA
ncbi:hypothetical protein F5X68DRAFT_243923 [Plectosphaerella plurivora]|uniref:Uncharacterized protein n=1 Tax=Plectosphaerella plurivora TaxID=936078 RepID=A0A9P9AG91_9PEZI|nr:hypothetical protein F5X68DRAFT_243923 [Plectosphaerella plurivora]